MKIVLLASLCGDGFGIAPNRLVECSDKEGASLIENGYARPLSKNEPTEEQKAGLFVMPSGEQPASDEEEEQGGNLEPDFKLVDMTVAQLKDLAKQMSIEVKSSATKAELIAAIEDHKSE